jgi:hypothetical protein
MRSLACRRGVTLLELMLVLVQLVAFAAVLHALVRLAAGQANGALRRAAAGRDQVTVWALTARELGHAEASDVTVPAYTTVEFDRPVAEGPVCASAASAVTVRSEHGGVLRLPTAGRDRLLVREPTVDGVWLWRGIVSVGVANCPDGMPAIVIGIDTPIPAAGFARVMEPVRLRSYRSGGAHALGLEGRSDGATIQPLAGPLDSNAFHAAVGGNLLHLSLSRDPLAPMHLSFWLGTSP